MNPALASALEGRYTVDREVGRGGMATVYLARDVRHNRNVALKVLNPELGAVLGIALAVSNAGGSRITQTGLSLDWGRELREKTAPRK
ncbi:MAG: hypothetical protein ACREPM_13880 [Gemmatimonadaceae bacterium]